MSTFHIDANRTCVPPAGFCPPAVGFAQGFERLLGNLAAATHLCAGLLAELPPVPHSPAQAGGIAGLLGQIGGLLQVVGNLLGSRLPRGPQMGHATTAYAPPMAMVPAALSIGNLLSGQFGAMPGLGMPGSGVGLFGGSQPPLLPLLQAGVSPQLAGNVNQAWHSLVLDNIFTHGRRY